MIEYDEMKEGIDEKGTPDMKYYAFDWDDNIMIMPTKIILKDKDGDEVGMSTEDFAKYRSIIGKEDFEYEGHTIVGFAENSFRFFRTSGDKQFLIDSMLGKPGPAWPDFVEAINNGSIFAIITARGHTPSVIKESVYNLIISNKNGLDTNEVIKNLEKFRDIADKKELPPRKLIRSYLNLCRFYPVSYKENTSISPEESKVRALEEFVEYIKRQSIFINKKAYLKNKIRNSFLPRLGFSDDDIKNLEKIKKHFSNKPENIVKTYSTAGGVKSSY